MIIIPNGKIIRIYHHIKTPTYWQYEDEALRYHNRLGIVLGKVESSDWVNVYEILVGKRRISLGRGWIRYPCNKPFV